MTDFVPGPNDPSPVTRVLAFGYHDGATDGVMQLGADGPVYQFEMADDDLGGEVRREYRLRRMPSDSLDRLAAVVGEHIEPRWPVWAPLWQFPTDEIRAEVDARIDAILRLAAEPSWQIVTSDLIGFTSLIAEPMAAMVRAGK